ncbi:MAG: hypothetical protein MUP97_01735, partial [Acidimicrobiia bacterium]|nr:hypothetical protein [Acidimicrobiia bacterium]
GRGGTADSFFAWQFIPWRFAILALTSSSPSLPGVFGTPVPGLQGFLDRSVSPHQGVGVPSAR